MVHRALFRPTGARDPPAGDEHLAIGTLVYRTALVHGRHRRLTPEPVRIIEVVEIEGEVRYWTSDHCLCPAGWLEPINVAPKATGDKRKEEGNPMPVLQWNEHTTLPPGDYSAIVTEIEEEEGQYGLQLRFQFVVVDDDGRKTDQEIRGWASAKWGPKTKLLDWAKALLGKKCPRANDPLDTDLLIGRKCDLRVEERPGQQGQMRSAVAGVYPYRSITMLDEDDLGPDEIPFDRSN